MEIWKSVRSAFGFYEVSSTGGMRSLDRVVNHSSGGISKIKGEKISATINEYGYRQTTISLNGNKRNILVHRIIAEAFIPNFYGKLFVNHKNGIRADNRVDNLEWCTQQENMEHRHIFLGDPARYGIRIFQANWDGQIMKTWDNFTQAMTSGYERTGLSSSLNGHTRQYKGFLWWYEGYEPDLSRMDLSGLKKGNGLSKRVVQLSKDGVFIKEWETIGKAGRELGIQAKNISRSLKYPQKTTGGCKWKYAQ